MTMTVARWWCSLCAVFLLLMSCVTTSHRAQPALYPPVETGRKADDFRERSHKGMVVAAHSLASAAGAEMLDVGGNAMDAAVAASFVISVVRPHSTGLGGGGFMLWHEHAGKDTRVFDFRERAPLAATKHMYLSLNGEFKKVTFAGKPVPNPSMNGHLAVAVPGLVKGLLHTHRQHGLLPLAQVMAPAIKAARLGFVVYPTLAEALDERRDILALFPSTTKIFFKDGRPLRQGELLVQSDLADTLTLIAEKGASAFYDGLIGDQIVAEVKRGGGLLSKKDLAQYKVIERQAVVGTYRGFKIVSMPPPSSGGVHIIEMLNMLEQDDLRQVDETPGQFAHLLGEVMRRAFADRATYMGDPDFTRVPTNALISKPYAKRLRDSIRKDRASVSASIRNPQVGAGESSSTTHISAVDRWGNAVSTTQTINYSFGSCVVASGTGVVLNDEMDDFSVKPGMPNAFGLVQSEANAIAPYKTPLSSMSPTIVFDTNGNVKMVLGSPGGPKIINAVLQTLIQVLDFKRSLLAAVHATRLHHQWLPDQLRYEKGALTPEDELRLRNMGHVLTSVDSIGEVQAILRLDEGGWEGVADPRSEGRARGQR